MKSTELPSTSTPEDRVVAHDTLRHSLDELASRGRRRMRAHSLKLAFLDARSWWPVSLAAGPASLVLWQGLSLLSGRAVGAPGWLLLGGSLFVGPLLHTAYSVLVAALRFKAERADTLALFDRCFKPQDRLRTADEFLRYTDLEAETREAAFMRAAIDDAAGSIRTALIEAVPVIELKTTVVPRTRWLGVLAAAALLLFSQYSPLSRTLSADASAALRNSGAYGASAQEQQKTPGTPQSPNAKAATPPEADPLAQQQRSSRMRKAQTETRNANEPSSSNASPAAAADASASANGSATLRKQQKPKQETPPNPGATAQPGPEKARETAKPKPSENGQLAMQADSGSGRSPSSSNNSQMPTDQQAAADKAGAVPDRDVEDSSQEETDEQQKAESASQPMRNEQVKDVDRNLSPEPGGDFDPDERPNGRGGPSELKKSRGVPSMILGIPVPDRVPGTPGPGRTKVTQEYSKPTAENHPPSAALSHATRKGPIGILHQPELTPWRREILERYFQYQPQNTNETNRESEASKR